MSVSVVPPPALESSAPRERSARLVVAILLAVGVVACLLAGWMPLGVSIATVFLFAGPHNWIEARYFLSRMPARWGPLRPYFLTGLLGVLLLTASFAALPFAARRMHWTGEAWLVAVGAWNTLLVGWIICLVLMRSRQRPRRDWAWTLPLAAALIAASWTGPIAWDLGLVYLHPLIALWILDREIGRLRPEWRRAWRWSLAALPLLLGALWWRLANAPPLPGDDGLTLRITAHAGAEVLPGVSTHLLVSTHVFLETIHYAVWLIAIPCVAFRRTGWSIASIPIARRSPQWRHAVIAILASGALAAIVLWAGFLADYPLTRDIYFTVAMLHVLAEVPFLLRLL